MFAFLILQPHFLSYLCCKCEWRIGLWPNVNGELEFSSSEDHSNAKFPILSHHEKTMSSIKQNYDFVNKRRVTLKYRTKLRACLPPPFCFFAVFLPASFSSLCSSIKTWKHWEAHKYCNLINCLKVTSNSITFPPVPSARHCKTFVELIPCLSAFILQNAFITGNWLPYHLENSKYYLSSPEVGLRIFR